MPTWNLLLSGDDVLLMAVLLMAVRMCVFNPNQIKTTRFIGISNTLSSLTTTLSSVLSTLAIFVTLD